MKWFANWLEGRPHRATIVNIVMLSVVLTLADSAGLFLLIGGGALGLAGGCFLWRATRRTLANMVTSNVHYLAITWVPGLLALALAGVSLWLITSSPAGSLGYAVGIVLFAVESAMLTLAGSDLQARAA